MTIEIPKKASNKPSLVKAQLTADRLKEVLSYDPETGIFRWKLKVSHKRQAGSVAGSKLRIYIRIKIDGIDHFAHRLAWLYMTGRHPELQIDHKDGDGSNNRFGNLREATETQNRRNVGMRCNNRSGFKGISISGSRRWVARITVDRKGIHLGSFATPEEAHAAYLDASKKYHGEFSRDLSQT